MKMHFQLKCFKKRLVEAEKQENCSYMAKPTVEEGFTLTVVDKQKKARRCTRRKGQEAGYGLADIADKKMNLNQKLCLTLDLGASPLTSSVNSFSVCMGRAEG